MPATLPGLPAQVKFHPAPRGKDNKNTMTIDLATTPFSTFEATSMFLRLPPNWNHPGVTWRTLRRADRGREMFRIFLSDSAGGWTTDVQEEVSPWKMRLSGGRSSLEVAFDGPAVTGMRMRGPVKLASIHPILTVVRPMDSTGRAWWVQLNGGRVRYLLQVVSGNVSITRGDKAVEIVHAGEECVLRFEEFDFLPPSRAVGPELSFDEACERTRLAWEEWSQKFPPIAREWEPAGKLARYVMWSSTIGALGFLPRRTVLMSKNWMNLCWSWDHGVNALALAPTHPELAWDQFMVLFDFQKPNGAIPDAVGESDVQWAYLKPPVHGWLLGLLDRVPGFLTAARLEEIYPKLCLWTNFWRTRDLDGDGLPEYVHGNDSGWDNATIFDGQCIVASPDLVAWLILQLDFLADCAVRIGRPAEANLHRSHRVALQARLQSQLWDGKEFFARRAFTGERLDQAGCLLPRFGVLAMDHLPPEVAAAVIPDLRPDGPFVTRWGPASESPASPLYEPDGYWRGPIWGPLAIIVADILRRAGRRAEAEEVARRFSGLCAHAGCLAENYDALTGEGLCDRAYSAWGAAPFLVLADPSHPCNPGRA